MNQPRLFFAFNQYLRDGSAHALYCFRNAWWLAQTAPETRVTVLHPGRENAGDLGRHFGLLPLPNLDAPGLPAWRRAKGGSGLTLNLVFHLGVVWHLRRYSQPGDAFLTASFPKLFRFVSRGVWGLRDCPRVYEVHQLDLMDPGASQRRRQRERSVLGTAHLLVTTTDALRQRLQQEFPAIPVRNLGLACGFDPARFAPPAAGARPFTLAYIGSVYREQGVDWLLAAWPRIRAQQPGEVRLVVAGGSPPEIMRLKKTAEALGVPGIEIAGQVGIPALPDFLASVDALVIPALSEGRMPYVAITKGYDYLGLNRPVLASTLPSITEVMQPGVHCAGFTPGNEDALASALREIITSPARRRALVAVARQRAGELTWAARAQAYWHSLGEIRTD